jgi:hypothetical protein
MKIIIGLRKRFLKKDLGSLNVLMEVMTTTHRLMLTVTPATNWKPPKLMNPKKRRVPRRVLKLSLVSVRVHESVSKLS